MAALIARALLQGRYPVPRKLLAGRALAYGVPAVYGIGISHMLGLGCPFRDLIGLDCPGCGGTRAFFNLIRGDLFGALQDNALAVVLGAAIVPCVCLIALGWQFPSRLRTSFLGRYRWWFVLGAAVAWTVFRNLPAFAWLAPDRPHSA